MNEILNILTSSRDDRIQLFFEKLRNNTEQFREFLVNNTLVKIPEISDIPNKRYWRSRITFPISYKSTTKYRLRWNSNIYDLYKFNCNYSFFWVPEDSLITPKFLTSVSATPQFSFIFYMFYSLLEELTESGVKFKLKDYVYSPLTDKFSTSSSDNIITLTMLPVTNKQITKNHLYLSIINSN
jgi:hypothetical protein